MLGDEFARPGRLAVAAHADRAEIGRPVRQLSWSSRSGTGGRERIDIGAFRAALRELTDIGHGSARNASASPQGTVMRRVNRRFFCIFVAPCRRGNGCDGRRWPRARASSRRCGRPLRALRRESLSSLGSGAGSSPIVTCFDAPGSVTVNLRDALDGLRAGQPLAGAPSLVAVEIGGTTAPACPPPRFFCDDLFAAANAAACCSAAAFSSAILARTSRCGVPQPSNTEAVFPVAVMNAPMSRALARPCSLSLVVLRRYALRHE